MNVDIRTLALCAGYGGLELGLAAAFTHVGWQHRVAAYVEREAYAAAILARRMEEGALDSAPIWTDLTTFDAGAWRGAVDCVAAGFPCQPHSFAGSRKGVDDERWIWDSITGIIRESGAWLVVLENVAGLLSSGGFAPVLTDLAAMGFAAEWGVLSAGAVGASHRRERVFIVGYLDDARSAELGGLPNIGREEVLAVGGTSEISPMHHTASPRRESARQRSEADSESGQCVLGARLDELADSERADIERWRDAGIVEATPAEDPCNGDQRQRTGDAADHCRDDMANTSEPRCEGRELGTALHGARGGGASTWIS